jgi:hypothetical protein
MCWDRIERADTHRKCLGALWHQFGKDDPYIPRVKVEDDGTGIIWVEGPHRGFPRIFSLELGEMLYQLRAALDGSVYESAVLDSGQDPPPHENRLQFPITPTAIKFKEARDGIAPLSHKRRSYIESVQPYNAPELAPELMVFNFHRGLGILNDWARKDRHRQLHVIGSWAANISPMLEIPSGVGLIYMVPSDAGFLENESEVATFKLSGWIPGMDIKANPNLTIDIAVDEIPPPCAENDTLSNRLTAIFLSVNCAVSALEGM